MIIVRQTASSQKKFKKLHSNQIEDLNAAIKTIIENPLIGEQKKGDLAIVRVFKFKMMKQLTLLAYLFDAHLQIITLIGLGSHENFYRDLKT